MTLMPTWLPMAAAFAGVIVGGGIALLAFWLNRK